jgi:hypothetical protein
MKWILALVLMASITSGAQLYYSNLGGVEVTRDIYLRQFENDDSVALAVRNRSLVLGHLMALNLGLWGAVVVVSAYQFSKGKTNV